MRWFTHQIRGGGLLQYATTQLGAAKPKMILNRHALLAVVTSDHNSISSTWI